MVVGHAEIGALVRAVEGAVEGAVDGRGEDVFGARLSPADWLRLAESLQRLELRPGDLLLRRGDVGNSAYLVEAGRLQVFVTGVAPRSHRVATLTAGTMVGEPGLFAAARRMAHVEAVTPCVVWALGAERLRSLAAADPALVLEVLRAAGALMAARTQAAVERGIPFS